MLTYFEKIDIPRPAHIGPGSWQLSRLTPLSILFGKNGSGKSQLMRAWRDSDPSGSHYVVPERTGDLGYNPSYLQQQMSGQQRQATTTRNFVSEYRQQIVARIQAYFAARGDTRAGQLPGDPAEVESFLNELLPDFFVAISGTKNPPYVLTRSNDGAQISNIDQLSSGEAQLLTIALDVITIGAIWDVQGAEKRVLLVDEPDAHIHPDLQVRFADFLVRVGNRYKLQIVVATHSTTLLSALGQFGAGKTAVIYLDRTRPDFKAEAFTSVHKEIASCLGGHALMGPLFGVPLLLVEGDDDYRLWSQIPRHHVVSFAVVPCNGDEIFKYQLALEKIFGSLREKGAVPAGFALLDGDKGLPTASPQVPQDHILFVRLECHESENLYLSDECLALLSLNWNTAVERILEKASQFGSKAEKLTAAKNWDRKKVDVKDVINQVAQILDPKNVHWTIRVAAAIGRTRPSGQLLEFLGQRVVDLLWGELQTGSAGESPAGQK